MYKFGNNWALIILICFLLIASFPGDGFATQLAAPSGLDLSSVVISPGDPIDIAVAIFYDYPNYEDSLNAIQMAFDDYGSIKGFTLRRKDYNAGCNVGSGETAANSIVADSKNVGVIGPLCSSSTEGAAPVFETAGVVMISPANTRPDLYSYGPNIFNRVVIADPDFDFWNNVKAKLPTVISWEADFTTKYGAAPETFAKYYYDAAILLLTKIDNVSVLDGSGNLVIDRDALATAVRLTTGMAGVTGSISLDVYGTRLNELHNTVWTDNFTAQQLNSLWSWVAGDATHWSLASNSGFLRIVTQQTRKNTLVQTVPVPDYEIRTRLLFKPSENFQFAGLTIFKDINNHLSLGRAYCDTAPPACDGNGIYFDLVENGVLVGSNFSKQVAVDDEAYLRLVRSGNLYTSYFSDNGTEWIVIGTHTTDILPLSVGLFAHNNNQPVSEINADFDFFILEVEKNLIFLPVTLN